MAHWSQVFVGIPCGSDIGFDCADLAARVQREVFGHQVSVPSERLYRQFVANGQAKGHSKFRLMNKQINLLKDDYAVRTESPEEGDPVLLKTRGFIQHIGVYCEIAGESWILHAADGAGQVVLNRIRELNVKGLFVEGYYKWKLPVQL